MKVNIILLNYNGKELMRECLPSIIKASKNSTHNSIVTVLDNGSTDGSIYFLKENFPEVKVYLARKNRVYSSYNEIAKSLNDDIIIVINNDIKVDKNFIDPLIEPFLHSDDILFTATRGYSFDGKIYEGDKAKAGFRWGIMEPVVKFNGYEEAIGSSGHTLSAGIGAFDRRKFLELGGYDDIYFPGRYEDVDLCYRGWKRGWRGIYQPESIQYHKGGQSFKKAYKGYQIARTVFRNSMIFMFKNITDISLMVRFLLLATIKALLHLLTGKFYMTAGYIDALRRLPLVIRRRKASITLFVLSDREVLERVNQG